MRTRITVVFGVCVLALSPATQADGGWTDYVTIAELVPTGRHYYEVRLPVRENPSRCKNKVWFYQDYNSPGSERMFQTFLEAVKSELRLRVYVTGKCNLNGYSEISSVGVVP